MTASYVVGVLAFQGAFQEHLQYLARASAAPQLQRHQFEFVPVRTESELARCHALVIPGGESTAMSLIAQRGAMLEPLRSFAAHKPVWGTCAGLIFMASEITNGRPHQQCLGAMDIAVSRNAFGRQLDSFDQKFDFPFAQIDSFGAVFIRAPVVSAVAGPKGHVRVGPKVAAEAAQSGQLISHPCQNTAPVEVLHTLENGLVVAVRQGHLLGTSFHPELSDDCRFHGWWLQEFVVQP